MNAGWLAVGMASGLLFMIYLLGEPQPYDKDQDDRIDALSTQISQMEAQK